MISGVNEYRGVDARASLCFLYSSPRFNSRSATGEEQLVGFGEGRAEEGRDELTVFSGGRESMDNDVEVLKDLDMIKLKNIRFPRVCEAVNLMMSRTTFLSTAFLPSLFLV